MKKLFSNLLLSARLFAIGNAISASVLLLAVAWPHAAMAQTVGDVMCNAFDNMGPLAPLFSAISYIAGAILIGAGLLSLKDHSDNPGNNPLHKGIARLAAGAALLTIPFVTQFLINTIFFVQAPGGGGVCIGGEAPVGGPMGGIGLDVLVENLVGNITEPFIDLISIVAYIMGILFIIRGLLRGAKYGSDPRASSTPHILAYLIIGATLIVGGQAIGDLTLTLLGMDTSDTINYGYNAVNTVMNWQAVQNFGPSAAQFATVIAAALTFFQLIGMLAFVRGLYIVKNAIEGAGQATVVQGFTHIVGGVLAINIYTILQVFDETFGTNFLV